MRQLEDLAVVGVVPDEGPVFQSDRFDLYRDAIADLERRAMTYECYCSRKDIRDAVHAPHGEVVLYPGTCRNLSDKEREQKRTERPAAIRLRAEVTSHSFTDLVAGEHKGTVDDVVLCRNDGVPSYNIAVVVDDASQGVSEVVRGNDLLGVTPAHIELQRLLGLPNVQYRHVPLVVGPDGERLAKRHGGVTLDALRDQGVNFDLVHQWLRQHSGFHNDKFSWDAVSREPVMWDESSFVANE
jgi:glutamyl-tRNA synthetase